MLGHCTSAKTTTKNIVETASSAGKFKTLLAAAQAAGLAGTLRGQGPFTVFAPTDEAFAKLPKGTVETLLKPENRDKLAAILKYHVVPGNVKLSKALEVGQGKTVLGPSLTFKFNDGRVKVGAANLVSADIAASNGTIHVIDSVLLPPTTETTGPAKARKMIELAIARGVPLFNSGNHDACKALYEVTAEALMNMPSAKISPDSIDKVQKALARIKDQTSTRDQAWTLRHALDSVYENLESRADCAGIGGEVRKTTLMRRCLLVAGSRHHGTGGSMRSGSSSCCQSILTVFASAARSVRLIVVGKPPTCPC